MSSLVSRLDSLPSDGDWGTTDEGSDVEDGSIDDDLTISMEDNTEDESMVNARRECTGEEIAEEERQRASIDEINVINDRRLRSGRAFMLQRRKKDKAVIKKCYTYELEKVENEVQRDLRKVMYASLCLKSMMSIFMPGSYNEAVNCADADKWREGMKEEIDSLIENGTWRLVPRPKHTPIVGNKWVYKVKMSADH